MIHDEKVLGNFVLIEKQYEIFSLVAMFGSPNYLHSPIIVEGGIFGGPPAENFHNVFH